MNERGLGKPRGATNVPWIVGPRAKEFQKFTDKAPGVLNGTAKWTREERDKLLAALWMALNA